MARLSGKLEILVYSDSAASNDPQHRICDIKQTLSDITISEFQPMLIQVADAVTDQDINFNNIASGEYLYIISDQTISIKVNGGAAIQCTKIYLEGGNLTSLSISNASGSVANIELGLGK